MGHRRVQSSICDLTMATWTLLQWYVSVEVCGNYYIVQWYAVGIEEELLL